VVAAFGLGGPHCSGRRYDSGVMLLLDLPWRGDFGHHRYLLDAIQ
jgi:hypothetical protein